jgi:hypothetical protein
MLPYCSLGDIGKFQVSGAGGFRLAVIETSEGLRSVSRSEDSALTVNLLEERTIWIQIVQKANEQQSATGIQERRVNSP